MHTRSCLPQTLNSVVCKICGTTYTLVLVWKAAARIAERECGDFTPTKLVLVECVAGLHIPLIKPPLAMPMNAANDCNNTIN